MDEEMKDDYKKLSHEWGSKGRKADSRAAKSQLKKPTKEDLEDVVQERYMLRWYDKDTDDLLGEKVSPLDEVALRNLGIIPAEYAPDAYEVTASRAKQLGIKPSNFKKYYYYIECDSYNHWIEGYNRFKG